MSERFFNPKHGGICFRGVYMTPELIGVLKEANIAIMCRFCDTNGQNILHMSLLNDLWPDPTMGSAELH
jgi:hypothetical protein